MFYSLNQISLIYCFAKKAQLFDFQNKTDFLKKIFTHNSIFYRIIYYYCNTI